MTTSQSTNLKLTYSDGNDTFDYVTFFKNNFEIIDAKFAPLTPPSWVNAPLFTASGWSAASGQTVPAYIVDGGWISFRGVATGGGAGSWVVLMPTGLKIEKSQKFLCATNASNGSLGVTVNPDGSFVVDSAMTGGAWVDLSTIRYKVFA